MRTLSLLLLVVTIPLLALAAPLPQREPPRPTLEGTDWSGSWLMHWSGPTSRWWTTFGPGGAYRAEWDHGGLVYVGQWSVIGNTFCINESNWPEDPDSYVLYEVTIDPVTLSGPIVAISAHGERVTLENGGTISLFRVERVKAPREE